ncbi:MAG: hypothetical protein IJK18_05415 [Clostridia bacterium]|nr:hypothetical protein [Clostridia bacterium]
MKKKVLVIAIIVMLIIMLVVLTGCGNEIKNEPVSSSNQISSNENQTKVQEQTQELSNEDIIHKYEEYRKEMNIEKISNLIDTDASYNYMKYKYLETETFKNEELWLKIKDKKADLRKYINDSIEYIFDDNHINTIRDYKIYNIEKIETIDELKNELKKNNYSGSMGVSTNGDEKYIEGLNTKYEYYLAVVTEDGKDNQINTFIFSKEGNLVDIGIGYQGVYILSNVANKMALEKK